MPYKLKLCRNLLLICHVLYLTCLCPSAQAHARLFVSLPVCCKLTELEHLHNSGNSFCLQQNPPSPAHWGLLMLPLCKNEHFQRHFARPDATAACCKQASCSLTPRSSNRNWRTKMLHTLQRIRLIAHKRHLLAMWRGLPAGASCQKLPQLALPAPST